MGCWNGTCFLSNLSIRAGDRIKLQLLMSTSGEQSSDYINLDEYEQGHDPRDINGLTYPCDNYFPFAPIITGEYNDYGSIENVKTDGNLSFLQNYVNELVKNKKIVSLQSVEKWLNRNRESKNPKKGLDATIPVKVDDIDEFIDMVERGSILVKGNRSWMRLRFVMMHEDIYLDAIKSMSKWKDWQGKNIVNSQKEKQKQIINFYINGVMPPSEDKEFNVTTEDVGGSAILRILAREILWGDFRYSDNRLMYKSYLIDFCESTKDADVIADAVSKAFDSLNMNNYLLALRKPWALTGGAGSQDDNEKEINAHNKVISKFITNHKKELKARYGE